MEIVYWSDYACPYCYIGETRLKNAISELSLDNQVNWKMKAYQLDPEAPQKADTNTPERFARKYGISLPEAERRVHHIDRLGKALGLDFNYGKTKFTNTMDAHRLTKLAQELGDESVTDKLSELLYDAYFVKDLELADHKVLKELALEAGLPEDRVDEVLAGEAYLDEVRTDEAEALRLGIHGVPYFVVDGMIAIPGALGTEAFKEALGKIIDLQQTGHMTINGQACGSEGCALA